MKKYFILFYILFISLNVLFAGTNEDSTLINLNAHIGYLASDELEGRGIGSVGIDKAAKYIKDQYQSMGLEPGGDNDTYFQSFEITVGVKVEDETSLRLNGKDYELNKDFTALGISTSDDVSGNLVFAGYGITANEYNYDDYEKVDVQDKIVLLLTAEPGENDSTSQFDGVNPTVYSELREKANLARKRGARAVVLMNGPLYYPQDKELPAIKKSMGYYDVGIPVVHIKQALIFNYIDSDTLLKWQQKIDKTSESQSRMLDGVEMSIKTRLKADKSIVKNVIGVVKPQSSDDMDSPVIIGAHYDHLGYGGPSSLAPGVHEIHNGADDNASGVAAIIEIARKLMENREQLVRPIVVIAFTSEEVGLIGSTYYVKHPRYPNEKTVAMLNLDAVGRMVNDGLIVFGTETAKEWTTLLSMYNKKYGFKLTLKADGYGPSDHASFVLKKIPVLHFFTGANADYHKPSDDIEKINFPDLDKLTAYVTDIAMYLAAESSHITYVHKPMKKKESGTESSRHKGKRPWLGTVPDFSYQDGDGFRLNGVSPGSPCEKADMRGGDIITKIDDMKINSIYDLMSMLKKRAPGDEITVYFVRDGEELMKKITLDQR